MLFLLFEVGDDRYALAASRVAEVLPLVAIKQIPQAPPGVAGAIHYRGGPLPVIDLSALAIGRPAAVRLSTRIIVVAWADGAGEDRPLGLIAERATATLRRDLADFTAPGVSSPDAAYLGPVTADPHGLIQLVEVDGLLSPAVREALWRQVAELPPS